MCMCIARGAYGGYRNLGIFEYLVTKYVIFVSYLCLVPCIILSCLFNDSEFEQTSNMELN